MYGPVTIFAHQLTNSTEKAEVAILVLGVNNIKGHAVSRVPATGRHQQSRIAGLVMGSRQNGMPTNFT
jgi:hypothetical protein